jgi:hypothetical protein
MLHDATLRLPVEITTSVFAVLALLALTFSELRFLKTLCKLDSLFAKAVLESLVVFPQSTWLQKRKKR